MFVIPYYSTRLDFSLAPCPQSQPQGQPFNSLFTLRGLGLDVRAQGKTKTQSCGIIR